MDYIKALTGEGIKEILKKNIIILHGEQELLMEEILDKIVEEVLDKNFKEFDYTAFDVEALKSDQEEKSNIIKDVIEQLEAFPFGSRKKIVLIRKGEALSGEYKNSLSGYVTAIPSSSILIIMLKGKNLPLMLGSKLEKVIKNTSATISCTIKANEITRWIIEKTAKSGKTIGPEESKLLLNRVGTDLREITNEINKLSSFVEPSFRITKEDIEACCIQNIQSGVFELIDAVSIGQTFRALTIFSNLRRQNEEPLKLMALFNNHFNLIRQIRELKEKRIAPREITGLFQKLGEHPFRIQKALDNNHFSLEGLRKIQKLLLEADISIKTGRQSPELVIELLIVMLCQEARKKKKYTPVSRK